MFLFKRGIVRHCRQVTTFGSYIKSIRFYASISRNKIKKGGGKEIKFTVPQFISVDKLANLLNCKVKVLLDDLKKLGFNNVTTNYILSKEYIELILQEYNYKTTNNKSSDEVTSESIQETLRKKLNPKNLVQKTPVVTIMGHIDHGKTTIIDYLRNSSIVKGEHGGITQHIGAFQIVTPKTKKKITFLDTPGHEAFLKMRERGANITDIIILVISVEDSTMPQTIEAIKHIKKSGNQLIVAITKIDRFDNKKELEKRIENVTNDLIINEVNVEKIGGDVQVIPISAKTGENMDTLEESIIVLSELMELKTENSKNTAVEGWVIESELNKSIGSSATVLVKKGTLTKGKILVCGSTYCKVKSMTGEGGKKLLNVAPSEAATILGWKDIPGVGSEILEVESEAAAKKYLTKKAALLDAERKLAGIDQLNEERFKQKQLREKQQNAQDDELEDGESTNDTPKGPKQINFIVKADVSGSLEAIIDSIQHLGNEEVKCKIISSSAGIPTENDIKMAQISGSTILCFNLGSLPQDIINNKEKVEVKEYNVIYKLIEDVTEKLTENLKPIYEIKKLATVEIREVFNYSVKKKNVKIAGCKVSNGKISKSSLIQVTRGNDSNILYDGKLASLKQGKEDAAEIAKGKDCGITFDDGFDAFEVGDSITVYEKIKIQRYL